MLKISFRIASGAYKFLRRSAMVIAVVLMFVVTGLFLTMRYSILPDIERDQNANRRSNAFKTFESYNPSIYIAYFTPKPRL